MISFANDALQPVVKNINVGNGASNAYASECRTRQCGIYMPASPLWEEGSTRKDERGTRMPFETPPAKDGLDGDFIQKYARFNMSTNIDTLLIVSHATMLGHYFRARRNDYPDIDLNNIITCADQIQEVVLQVDLSPHQLEVQLRCLYNRINEIVLEDVPSEFEIAKNTMVFLLAKLLEIDDSF